MNRRHDDRPRSAAVSTSRRRALGVLQRLACAALLLGALLFALLQPAAADTGLRERLDELSDEYARLNVNAVVLVGNRDGLVYERAFGHADLATKAPLTVATPFKTESVGKLYTATRVLQLVEQGKLRLDDSAAQYLPGWNIAGLEKITVHQLLTHTAGLASMWDHPQYDFAKAYTPAELKRIVEEVPSIGEPGGRYFYSNNGYYLLGQIIAKVTGTDYEADLRRHIFDVAGMAATDHLKATAMPAGTAQPYIYFSSDRWRAHAVGVSPRANPAGGWVSPAHDLFAFAQAYLGGKLIKPETLRMQWTANGDPKLAQDGNHYAYGSEVFVNTQVPGKTIVGHSGGGGGFSIDLFMEPESGTVVVVMCNIHAMNREMSGNYLGVALGQPARPARHSKLVRTVDHLLLKGLEHLKADPVRFFREIDVPKYSRYFLEEVANFLNEIERQDLARGVEEMSRQLHGEAEKQA